ncbi:MAG TPA: ATP-binding protein, partial [Polyangiaceae bacterium]
MLCTGRPATFAFDGEPIEGGALLVGIRVDDDVQASLGSVNESFAELTELHRQLERERRELADSNRALTAMHAEIDDMNAELRRASDVKTRVVSNVSHEFRTPINSILGITQLMLARLDGELTTEQERQLQFVRTSAQSLSDLVNDLLDLSRIEAGRHDLRVSRSTVEELFSSLRGMMKPLTNEETVTLMLEASGDLPPLETDVAKLGQILRNLLSNALKFTERGHVRVTAELQDGDRIAFRVEDTGIGLAPEDRERVFDEFTQIDSALQRKVQGTGLGLSLSRKFAELLGGSLTVESELGQGSVFTLSIPAKHVEVELVDDIAARSREVDTTKTQVLVVEDNRQTLFLYERYLRNAGFQVVPARTIAEARAAVARVVPAAIVLDVMLEGEATWLFLRELKDDTKTRDVPVMVVTVVDRSKQARALGADEFWLKPIDGDQLVRKLERLAKRGRAARILVIDDDEAARYLVRKLLQDQPYSVVEAETAAQGIRAAREQQPDVILLDFVLGQETAFDV